MPCFFAESLSRLFGSIAMFCALALFLPCGCGSPSSVPGDPRNCDGSCSPDGGTAKGQPAVVTCSAAGNSQPDGSCAAGIANSLCNNQNPVTKSDCICRKVGMMEPYKCLCRYLP
jgi:hypothetical protein